MSAQARENSTEQLKDQAGEVVDDLRELGRLAKAVLGERADELKQGATASKDAAQEKLVDARDDLADRVREQPLRGLAVAAAVGALVGILWSRR